MTGENYPIRRREEIEEMLRLIEDYWIANPYLRFGQIVTTLLAYYGPGGPPENTLPELDYNAMVTGIARIKRHTEIQKSREAAPQRGQD